MRKISTIFALVVFALFSNFNLFAQESHTIDFEPDGVGADWDWEVGENADNPPLEFVDNPDPSGINTSTKVAKFTARETGNPWALFFTTDDGEFTFDENNSMVKIMVHKPRTSTVAIKFEGGTGQPIEIPIENTVVGEWQELTYDFSGLIGSTYAKMVIIPDNAPDRSGDLEIYIDNIVVPDGVVPNLAEPTSPAPTPSVDEQYVMSIFSDAYTDIEGTDFNPQWGQGTEVSNFMIGEDNVIQYSFLNFQGTVFANPIDLTGMLYIHLDYWTPNAETLEFFLISQSSGEQKIDLEIQTEQWISVDIPLSHFTDLGLTITDIHQLKVEGNGTVYFDNIYFTSVITSVEENDMSFGTFTLRQNYPNPFSINTQIEFSLKQSNNVSLVVHDIFGNEITELVNDFLANGEYSFNFNAEGLSSGTYFITLTVGNSINTKSMTITK